MCVLGVKIYIHVFIHCIMYFFLHARYLFFVNKIGVFMILDDVPEVELFQLCTLTMKAVPNCTASDRR